jgi:GNAT superfamily N-acetyltransferase
MTQPVTIRNATADDLPAWIELAREVEPLFGPMPDIATHIQRGIVRGTAIVADGPEGHVDGAALLSRDDAPHHIHWLAVRSDARRRGVGSSLLAAILRRWADGQPIHVVTFGADVAGGVPARALYMAHGFHFHDHTENGPEGGSREHWIRT